MERDDIGRLEQEAIHRAELVVGRPFAVPWGGGERLRGVDGAGPGEDLFQQRQDVFFLVLEIARAVGRAVVVVRLVPQVPAQDPAIVLEAAQDARHVRFHALPFLSVLENCDTGRLHPAGVVPVRRRRRLFARLRLRMPAAIEEYKHQTNLMAVGDFEEPVDALCESLGVFLPRQIVQEDAHRREAEIVSPAELAVDGLWIERVGLPHFQLVDRA